MIDRDVDRVVRVVIDDRQALEPTTALETVADEIHRPDLVRRHRHLERTTLHRNTTSALAPRHLQAFLAVYPLHTLAFDRQPLAADQCMDAAIAEPATLRSEQLDCLAQATLVPATGRPISQHRAREPHQPTRPTLGYSGLCLQRLSQELLEPPVLALELLHGRPSLHLPQEPDDLLVSESRLLHARSRLKNRALRSFPWY